MEISAEHVKRYMDLYLEEYKKPIAEADARNELTALVCMLKNIEKHMNTYGERKNTVGQN